MTHVFWGRTFRFYMFCVWIFAGCFLILNESDAWVVEIVFRDAYPVFGLFVFAERIVYSEKFILKIFRVRIYNP